MGMLMLSGHACRIALNARALLPIPLSLLPEGIAFASRAHL